MTKLTGFAFLCFLTYRSLCTELQKSKLINEISLVPMLLGLKKKKIKGFVNPPQKKEKFRKSEPNSKLE